MFFSMLLVPLSFDPNCSTISTHDAMIWSRMLLLKHHLAKKKRPAGKMLQHLQQNIAKHTNFDIPRHPQTSPDQQIPESKPTKWPGQWKHHAVPPARFLQQTGHRDHLGSSHDPTVAISQCIPTIRSVPYHLFVFCYGLPRWLARRFQTKLVWWFVNTLNSFRFGGIKVNSSTVIPKQYGS